MIQGHKIREKIEGEHFFELIHNIKKENIKVSEHCLFRLRRNERKPFKEQILIEFVLNQKPLLVGVQQNGLYAAFYKYGQKVVRLILEIAPEKIKIVTFYFIEGIPRI